MTRTTLTLSLLLLPACYADKLQAILDNHDSGGWADSSTGAHTDASSSTGLASTTGRDETLGDTTGTTAASLDTAGVSSSGGAGETVDTSTTSPGTDSSSSSTGPAQPFCGDGIIDPGESCDDMNDNPDDGCKLCTRDRIVFSSSVEYDGRDLEGLYGADQRCRMLAAIAMLPNFATYRAWLSDSKTAAADRILHSKGRYVLVNGLVVAADWDALISGTLENPINVTEFSGVSVGQAVWTGTLANGQPAFGTNFCADWTEEADAFDLAGAGIRNDTDAKWSFAVHDPCPADASIYCFEN